MRRLRTSAAALLTGLALTVPVAATADAASPAPARATAASACHPLSFQHYNTIRQGSKGSQARAMECLLHQVGRSTSVNGSFSAHDASELARYRASIGFRPLRVAGRLAWASLLSRGGRPELHRGAQGADVLRLQRALQSLGWTKVDLNGRYDARTVRVVKAAQQQRHLKQTGTASATLWHGLQTGKLAGPAVARKSSAGYSGKGATALAFARRQLGDPYRFGASGPNAWDCSGLTAGAWRRAGVSLPHNAAAQFHRGRHIAKSQLRPGDLVFFYSGPSHVAIYAGHGMVIHAPRPGKRVSYIKMKYMPFRGARRP
jgi:cell wall-associated NlpC family hydrolase